MKPSVGIGIFEQAVAFLTPLSALNLPLFALHLKIIGIDKVVAGVVRRVYKNAVFDTTEKSLLRHINAEKGLK